MRLSYCKLNLVSLTIFIEDNQGGNDISKIQKIAFYGTTWVHDPLLSHLCFFSFKTSCDPIYFALIINFSLLDIFTIIISRYFLYIWRARACVRTRTHVYVYIYTYTCTITYKWVIVDQVVMVGGLARVLFDTTRSSF